MCSNTVTYVGIDIGKKGAVVTIAVVPSLNIVIGSAWDTPLLEDGSHDVHGMLRVAKQATTWGTQRVGVVLEKPMAFSKGKSGLQGVAYSAGLWEGVLAACAHSVQHGTLVYVAPVSWQKDFKHMPGENAKERAIAACRRYLPKLDLLPGRKRTPHDGRSDAACMALWLAAQDGYDSWKRRK